MRFRHEWLILPLFFIVFRVFSQEPSFRNFSVDQGLPSSECYQILQSKEGYIWVVTDNGVAKFDGYKFHVYNRKNGLPENTVFRLHEDGHGRIWFVCASGSMAVYENGKLFSLPESVNRRLKQYIKYGLINSVASYKDTVYLGYSSTSVSLKLVKNRNTFKLLQNKRHTKRGAYIQILPNKQIVCGWVVYPGDMIQTQCRFVDGQHDYTVKNLFKEKVDWWFRAYAFGNQIFSIQGDDVCYFKRGKNRCFKKNFNSKIIQLKYQLSKHDKRFWVATTVGLYVYPKLNSFNKQALYLKGRAVSDIIRDREGGYWIATLNRGVYYCKNLDIENFETKGRIFSVTEEKGTIYLGMENGVFAKKTGSNIQYINLKNNYFGAPVYKIVVDKDHLWLRYSALVKYSIVRGKAVHFSNKYHNYDFCVDTLTQKIWGLGRNVVYLHDEGNDYDVYEFKKYVDKYNCIAVADDAKLLVGGTRGLGEFDRKKRTFHYLSNSIKNIRYIAIKDKIVWLGSKEQGIQIRNGRHIYQLNTQKGLRTDYCVHIFLEKSNIGWLSTNKGIAKVTVQSWQPFRYKCQFLTKKDGLISNEILQTIKIGEKVIAVGNGGYSEFHSDALSLPVYQPKVFLTGLKINNGKVAADSGKSLRLTKSGVDLRVDFMSLCFRKEGAIRYRFRLDGVDQQWKYTKSTFAEYNTLPAGKLTFKVQAQSASGMWDTPVTTQTFYVPVPFIERWYIRLGILMLLATLIWLFVRWRIRRVQKRATDRETLLQKASEMELKFLTGQMNPHFTFNAMNSIQHFMLNNDLLGAQKYLTKYSKLIRNVMESNMLEYVSLDKELNLLQLYVEIESMRFSKPIRFEVTCPDELRSTISIPPMFFQPYIENAIWHGLFSDRITDARITVVISLEEPFLKCMVEDNGIGRAEALRNNDKNGRQSLGMLITHKRLDSIARDQYKEPEIIDLTDENGRAAGTRVLVYLPYIQT
jgi:ligand-binding sensor domain-containing protein